MDKAMAVVVVLILLLALGFYLGWLNLSSRSENADKTHIELTVDRQKARDDADKLDEQARETGRKIKRALTEDDKPVETR